MATKYNTAIIHSLARKDRREVVGALKKLFPASEIFKAIIPVWEERRDTRSIKGSSLSHAQAFKTLSKGKPILVLEDDALLVGDSMPEIPNLPDDCGILLLGGETPNVISRGDGFIEVFVPYHGAHAFLYNTPALVEKGFLGHLWELLAMTPLREDAACYEGVVYAALERSGLKLLRMENTFFTTVPSVSDRTGKVEPPRITGDVKASEFRKSTPVQQPVVEFQKFSEQK